MPNVFLSKLQRAFISQCNEGGGKVKTNNLHNNSKLIQVHVQDSLLSQRRNLLHSQ